MKIAIVHHDLEWSEEKIRDLLIERGISVELIDIREAKLEDFKEGDVVFNRIYASVANRDYASIEKTLVLLKKLEEKKIYCVNSYITSFYDYSKFDSYKIMKEKGIITPETLFIRSREKINNFIRFVESKFDFPVVVKRNTGGRAKDISKINSKEELKKDLQNKFKLAKKEKYFGGFIVQEFVKSVRDYDCRLGIVDGKFAFSYGRNLLAYHSEEKWLASVCKGSKRIEYNATNDEANLGLKASNLIGAEFNVLDLMFTEKGPIIIEHNPTPSYTSEDEMDIARVSKFLDIILNKIKNKEVTQVAKRIY